MYTKCILNNTIIANIKVGFITMQCVIEHGRIPAEVGAWGPDPRPEKSQKIGFLNNIGPDPLKNHKATKKASHHSMLGHHRPASEKSFKWHFAGGPMMAHL